MERYETNPAPELELGAAEAVLAQAPGLRDHVVGVCDFVEQVTPAIREELAPAICSAPEPEPAALLRLGAVDSSQKALQTAGLCSVFVIAFRTSARRSEDQRVSHVPLDSPFEVEAISRLVRSNLEADLLCADDDADQVLILDNSFISLVESASRAHLSRERVEPGSLAEAVLDRFVKLHLGPEGSLVRMMRQARVVAVPKVAGAQGLMHELYKRIGLSEEEQRSPAALAQSDRVLLRHVLRPGEYLPPRPLLPAKASQQGRLFHGQEFPAREELVQLFGAGVPAESQIGLDVVYFRPRRPEGAREGPVLRVELQRGISRQTQRLLRVLLTLEASLDGEHPEPMPQLLADYLVKSAVEHVPTALAQSAWFDLVATGGATGASARRLDIALSIFEEPRS